MVEAQHPIKPFHVHVTQAGMRVSYYAIALEQLPADFFADPDGAWTLEALAEAAGFSADQGIAVGALKQSFAGHPDGAAVVTLNAENRPYVAVIECPIAYACALSAETQRASAA